MLDSYLRPLLNPPLNLIGKSLADRQISANSVTLIGFAAGLAAMVLIINQMYIVAGFCIGLNRLCDGLDGAIARIQGLTDFGGFLDISCDFIIYSGVIFAFAYDQPQHALPAAFLIFSYIGPITTFLAYAIMAEKYKITTEIRGKKSFYYLGGICEGAETAIVMILLCLKPEWLPQVCTIYGVMCWMTTAGRVSSAWSLASYKAQEAKTVPQDRQEL